jgi:Transient receptor potential (TRP) ion channel/ML-like domain
VLSLSILTIYSGIAYSVPDLDGVVRIHINSTTTGESVACVEANLSNGKTVDQKGVAWTTAVIAGIALVASAISNGLGHSNTAAHVAANAMSLFGYFQGQAMLGMTAVALPPIVQSWTQNFQWSMGVIEVPFMQKIFTWYIQATGGKPATLLSDLSTTSVEVQKRSEKYLQRLLVRGLEEVHKRSSGILGKRADETNTSGVTIVKGIKRVAFRATIEQTNLFITGLTFFIIFILLTALCVALFKGFCEVATKAGWIKGDKFMDFRNGWRTVLKGIMYRLVVIGYPQMVVIDLWELTVRDSAACVVLAVFFFISMTVILAWASFKVIKIAKRSISLHKNPAYILYSDPASLNRWGFLYVQYKATSYYFVIPWLAYILIKGMFIAFAQGSGVTQAVALILIEAGFLVAVSIYRPWMDKRTNIFNISIAAINFLNSVFLLVFSNVFKQPGIVTGVMGVVLFVINAAFALILLVLVLISSVYALVSKNPDVRYQPMRDDRSSFIKSQPGLTTELDALGATARGDYKGVGKPREALDDDDLSSSGSMRQPGDSALHVPLPPSTAASGRNGNLRDPPDSPMNASSPFINQPVRGPPPGYNDGRNRMYAGYNADSRGSGASDLPLMNRNAGPEMRSNTASPMSRSGGGGRKANNASPWREFF